MNDRFEHLMYQAGMTAQGCWDEMDSSQREAVEKFAELIIQDVLNLFGDELISLHHLEQPCCEDAVYLLKSKVMDRFGVKYPHG